MDMLLEPVVDAVKGLSTALPEPQPLSSRSALQQQVPVPHEKSSSEQLGSSAGAHKPDAFPPVHRVRGGSAGSSDGRDDLGMLDLVDAPPRDGEGPPGSGGAGDRRPLRMVSLLARGLADQAAAAAAPPVVDPAALLQPSAADTGGAAAGAKPKRSAAWLLGLPHITTVRRMGKADA